MASMDSTAREALIDLLLDLQHDLGKYLHMPLTFLPRDATPAEVREALRKALFATRQGNNGTHAARALWESFLDEAGTEVRKTIGFGVLSAAVESALAWEERLDDEILDRGQLEQDLSAVAPAIRDLIQELEDAA